MRNLVIGLAVFINIVSVVPYIRAMLRHRTRPDSISWFTWSGLTLVGAISALASDLWLVSILLFASTASSLITAIMSVRYGTHRFYKSDAIAVGGGITCLILWYVTQSPLLAFYGILVIDMFGTLPTAVKILKDPKHETGITFALCAVSASMIIFTVGQYDLQNLLYPAYLLLMNVAFAVLIYIGKKRLHALKYGY